MKNKIDPERDFQIDENNLDSEWIGQPRLYFRYASGVADARRDLDECKSDLEVTKAELYRKISGCEDPAVYGLKKTTEAAIASAIVEQDSCREAQGAVVEARHRLDVLSAAVAALDHRKTALTKLVDLFLANYFSNPKASPGSKDRMDEVEKDSVRRRGRRSKRE